MSTHNSLQHTSPEAEGIAASAILAFVDAAEQHIDALHSLMLLRHGHVVAEGWWAPYAPELPHMLFSLSKSFTSTAIGLAVAEGRLSVNDPVLSFFPEDVPANPSTNLKAMRVRHLLSMSTGHHEDTTGHLHKCTDGNWAKAFLELPVEHEPGTYFVYNTGATYMLSAIVQAVTGEKLIDYLTPRLFEPLGIQGATWESCPRGINTGGFGLSVKTEDIARFGQLYLHTGVWQGRRILPEAWIAEASSPQAPFSAGGGPDWKEGYGYQFWRCQHNAYRGDGAFGQYCIVMPDQDAVLAITSGVKDMQAVLDRVWDMLLPAMGDAPLPADDAACSALNRKLARLALAPQAGQSWSPVAARVSGRTYTFPANDQELKAIAFHFGDHGCEVATSDGRGENQIACGYGAWVKGVTPFDSHDDLRPVAASGAWTSDDTYTVRLCYYETPFRPTLTYRFVDDQVLFNFEANVGFGPTQRPQLVGAMTSD